MTPTHREAPITREEIQRIRALAEQSYKTRLEFFSSLPDADYFIDCGREILIALCDAAERASSAVGDSFADKYHELIMAVAQKFPGESRHATALRYIRERESAGAYGAQKAALTPPKDSTPDYDAEGAVKQPEPVRGRG